jgi:threonine aldolase
MRGQRRSFASDNIAGAHPAILDAVLAANDGDAPAYGHDEQTTRAERMVGDELGAAAVFFVFGGTAANVLGLHAALRSHEAVVCAETAHLNVDECGAIERLIGAKLLPVPTADGKLRPADLDRFRHLRGVEHHAQPRVVTISQSTERGTVYTASELRALAARAHADGMLLHVDGARLANAAAALDCSLREITADAGVDILTLGGTKNGALAAEAVVFFDPALADGFRFIRKQGMQLASKMRFVAAQFEALFTSALWRHNAEHANRMARRLAEQASAVPGVRLTQPVEANAVFAALPASAIEPLQARHFFHVWDADANEVRWMTSWSTRPEDVDTFAASMREVLGT